MSEYMGRRVNAFLIIMIIIVLLGMGGLSIYYQRTFKNVNYEYDSVTSSLQSCRQNLTVTTMTLQNAQQNLNSTETDIKKYDDLYEQKSQELEAKKKDLADTQANLQKETMFKLKFQKQSEDYWRNIVSFQGNVTKLNNRIADLEDKLAEAEDLADCLAGKAGSSGAACY